MSHGDPKERLVGMIASLGVPLASLTPEAGLALMTRLYSDDPNDCSLSCEWTTVTRYGEEERGFDLTLWFRSPPEEPLAPEPPTLALIFKVGPPAMTGDFPQLWKCCGEPARLDEFRTAIERSPAFEAWGRSPPAGVALVYEDEKYARALFDCWGARDPSRPIVTMTEEEWLRSEDVSLMLRWFRQEWRGEEADLDRLLQRYCLACCRKIWRLLPQEESRAGVEIAERVVAGRATRDELGRADWLAETAAFRFDFDSNPEAIARWCDELSQIPSEELAAIIPAPRPEDDLSPRRLLHDAAFFADAAICYSGFHPEYIEKYARFLPASLLREMVGNPFREKPDRPCGAGR